MRELPNVFLIERDIADDGREGDFFNLVAACLIWWECVFFPSKVKKQWLNSEWKKHYGGR